MEFPIKRFENIPTPFYYYDLALLRTTLDAIHKAAPEPHFCVHYAIKANACDEILRQICSAGLGVDVVSGGEISAALNAGFDASKIVYAGVGKSDAEIEEALNAGIACFNVESEPELEVINEIALRMGKIANVALRINPDIDAHTHHYITTGLAENKFGIAREMLLHMARRCNELPGVTFTGLHFHIGSQITDNTPFTILCERINAMQDDLETAGVHLSTINVGGGLGIDYEAPDTHPIPDFDNYFSVFRKHLKLRRGQTLHFELGRAIVAQCGSLISRVLYVKKGLEKQFVIVDAGMTDLIRPALYQAHHKIENLTSTGTEEIYDVVGPICESSDCFGENEKLPVTQRGDILAFRSAGAYGQIMASQYNCRPLAKAYFSCCVDEPYDKPASSH